MKIDNLYKIILLIITILLIISFIFWKFNTVNKIINITNNSNEKFIDVSLDTIKLTEQDVNNIMESVSNPKGLMQLVSVTNLDKIINDKFDTIINRVEKYKTDMASDIDKLDVIDNLSIGTILIWNKNTLPNDKWEWCDERGTKLDLKYKLLLGGASPEYVSEEERETIPLMNGDGVIRKGQLAYLFDNKNKIKTHFMPKHSHKLGQSNRRFPNLSHNHSGTDRDGGHSHTTKSGNYLSGQQFTASHWQALKHYNDRIEKIHQYDYKHEPRRDTGYSEDWSKNNATEHRHTVYSGLDNVHNNIGGKVKCNNPIWFSSDTNNTPTPFYPKHELVNYIIKVA